MKSRMAITTSCAGSGVACGSQHRIGAGYHADRPVGGPSSIARRTLVLRPMRTTRASAMRQTSQPEKVTFDAECVLDDLGGLIFSLRWLTLTWTKATREVSSMQTWTNSQPMPR